MTDIWLMALLLGIGAAVLYPYTDDVRETTAVNGAFLMMLISCALCVIFGITGE